MSHVTHMISYVSFAEYSLVDRALLQKRPVILRSLLIVATPCLLCNTYDVTHPNESSPTHECVPENTCRVEFVRVYLLCNISMMSHIRMSQVTHMNVSQRMPDDWHECACTDEWVMSHIWMSHVTHMNMSQRMLADWLYGVATVSRIDTIIGLFCRISSLL